jgi:hypothetical protein
MYLRKLSWAQLTRDGVPPLFVLRPMGGANPPVVGTQHPVPDPSNRLAMTRARQLYEQRRIGTRDQLGAIAAKAATVLDKPAKHRKEKASGQG